MGAYTCVMVVAIWMAGCLAGEIQIITGDTEGELHAGYRYALGSGISWSTDEGNSRKGLLPELDFHKNTLCDTEYDKEMCVSVKSLSLFLPPRRFIRYILPKSEIKPNHTVHIPLEYGWDINRIALKHLVKNDKLPICTFNKDRGNKRQFTVGQAKFNRAWFKQIFVIVRYVTNVTDSTATSTLSEFTIFAPFFDKDCKAQALVEGLHNFVPGKRSIHISELVIKP